MILEMPPVHLFWEICVSPEWNEMEKQEIEMMWLVLVEYEGESMLQEEEYLPSMFHNSFDIEPSAPMDMVFCHSDIQILQSCNCFGQ